VLTQNHMMESLSRAYLQAVAAMAGLNLRLEQNTQEFDYGVDGTFYPIKRIGTSLVNSGFPLDFQLKATTNWKYISTDVVYSMRVEAYNKLVDRNSHNRAVPQILILFCLPTDSIEWLYHNEDQLLLRKCCYWKRLTGVLSGNSAQIAVRIPRLQQLNVHSLLKLLEDVKSGAWR
jgi:Domain of unknown function (DUF4365)